MHADDVVDCHVLVIGSGGAGVRAAIEAAGSGDTVLVTKTIPGKGGCTTMAEGGYNAVLRKRGLLRDPLRGHAQRGSILNDPRL